MVKTDIKQILYSFFIAISSKLLSVYKLSFVVGSHALFFSASNCAMPLIGVSGGVTLTTIICAGMFFLRLAAGSFSLSMLAFYIPGYCAALYLATQSRFFRCLTPLACMILFLTHSVGMQAALYASYWIIPCIIAMLGARSFFMQALGATLTAHAVGSVIWLYTVPMSAEAWLALIPLVAVERLTFTAGMVVCKYLFEKIYDTIGSLAVKTKASYASLTR